MIKKKRLVCIADLHCGHEVGLTPPDYQHSLTRKYADIQRECWDWYVKKAKELNPVDILVVNGDMIDGRGERSGGTELITGDRNKQVAMAIECIELWKAKTIALVRGTPYHTGQYESYEDNISKHFGNCKIGNHEWATVTFGKKKITTFDFKHYIGQSQVPYGRGTAVKRDEIWNALWAEAGMQPRAQWIVRSHVHYCESHSRWVGDKEVWAITTPALQAMGSRYGSQIMSGLVDFGLIHWDIYENGEINWKKHIAQISSQKAQELTL